MCPASGNRGVHTQIGLREKLLVRSLVLKNETGNISWFGWPALSRSFRPRKSTQIRVFPTLIWQNTTLLLEIGLRLVDSVRGLHPFRMFSNSTPLHFWAQLGTLRERKNAQNKNAKIVP